MWWNSIWSCIHYLGGSQDRAVKNQGTSGFFGTFRLRTKTTFPRHKEVIPNINFLASYSLLWSSNLNCFCLLRSRNVGYPQIHSHRIFKHLSQMHWQGFSMLLFNTSIPLFSYLLILRIVAPMHHMSRFFDCVCILLLTQRLLCIMQMRLHTLLLRTLTHQPMSPVNSKLMVFP